MSRKFTAIAVALSLFALGSTALAAKRCPSDDKQLPDGSTACRDGTLKQCVDGEWKDLGTKCTMKFQEDAASRNLAPLGIGNTGRLHPESVMARLAAQPQRGAIAIQN